jgi:hypothetical protein
MQALVADLSLSSVVVIIAVVAVLVLYYRWWRSVLVLVPPLLLATVYAFGIASLPPFNVTSLNSNTAFLDSIIVGNGINFGIVLLARYVEERRRGQAIEHALTTSVWSSRGGTLAAALAAGLSYVSLVATQFRGFRQFGIIGGIGMMLSWAVAFVLIPPLVARLDRDGSAARPQRDESRVTTWLARFVDRFRVPIVAVGVLVTIGAGMRARGFRLDQLELLGTYLTPTVILTDSPDQARAIAARLRDGMKRLPLAEAVANVRTLDDVLPLEQDEKIRETRAIREDMTPRLRAGLSPDKRDALDRLLGSDALAPIVLGDLRRTFTTALVERDSSSGRAILVYPRTSRALWEGPPLMAFVDELRSVSSRQGLPAARVAGSLPLSADILSSVRRDGPLASAAALLGVIVVVLLTSRRRVMMSLYVIASTEVGRDQTLRVETINARADQS